MNVRLYRTGLYLAVKVETARASMTLRRWPWPPNPTGRERHLRAAMCYGIELAGVLMCPFKIDEET